MQIPSACNRKKTPHKGNTPPKKRASRLMLITLALSLTACATPSPPAPAAKLPARPELTEPIPREPYSEHVRALLKSWADALTATPPTR